MTNEHSRISGAEMTVEPDIRRCDDIHMCLDEEGGSLAELHGGHSDVPALDHLPLAQREVEPRHHRQLVACRDSNRRTEGPHPPPSNAITRTGRLEILCIKDRIGFRKKNIYC